jgi:hypothetical protein
LKLLITALKDDFVLRLKDEHTDSTWLPSAKGLDIASFLSQTLLRLSSATCPIDDEHGLSIAASWNVVYEELRGWKAPRRVDPHRRDLALVNRHRSIIKSDILGR